MNAQDLTAALVEVYARLREGTVTASAARREAAGYFASLRKLTAEAKDKWEPKHTEYLADIPISHWDAESERLTLDFEPWKMSEVEALGCLLTTRDVSLLELYDSRPNPEVLRQLELNDVHFEQEIPESTAKAGDYILKAIRFGVTLAPIARLKAWEYLWGKLKRNLSCVPAEIIVSQNIEDESGEVAPPWPIWDQGKLAGYFVPKGWKKPEGEEFTAMLKRIDTASKRAEEEYRRWHP